MAQITAAFRQAALRRGILIRPNSGKATKAVAFAAGIEFANLGFVINPTELENFSDAELNKQLTEVRKIMGADRDMTPIYPGFPQQVAELSTLTLLVEQILHYWTGGAFLPDYPTVAREGLPIEDMLRDARELRVLPAAAAAREIIRDLTLAPVAISEDDVNLLNGAAELQHPDLALIKELASEAKNGENLQHFIAAAAAVSGHSVDEVFAAAAPGASNLDQLLRMILVLNTAPAAEQWKSQYALAVNTLSDTNARSVRFSKISRASRQVIVKRVGELSAGFKADGLQTRQNLWRGVMRAVHPYDYKLTDAERRAADIIHSNVEHRSLNSLVEDAMAKGDVTKVVELLSKYQPGNLLRRVVAILRLVDSIDEAVLLANALVTAGGRANISTLISAYNGILGANDEHARVNRVAGLNNTMLDRSNVKKVNKDYVVLVADAVKSALTSALAKKDAPKAPVAVQGTRAVPLVRRDASTTDRVVDRGEEFSIAGEGDILRIFSHWNNNQRSNGYMDIGLVIIDDKFEQIGVCTWNSWAGSRGWATYSGDKNVSPGDSAAEYFDVNLAKMKSEFPKARYAAMTVQSWSGWPIADVDFIAGAMYRSGNGQAGQVFDARTVATAFKPTTSSTQSVPLAIDLTTNRLVWIDSSNGSDASGVSSTNDSSIGGIVYDEIARPRLTMGELATLWAEAHGVETVDEPVERDALLALLG